MEGLRSQYEGYVCRRCGNRVSYEQYKLNRFCPKSNCETLLQLLPRPNYWLFQFNPKAYRWFDRIKENEDPEQWLTSQHFKRIHKGDMVAICASGDKAGVYAIGRITTNPSKNPLDSSQEKYFEDKNNIGKFLEKLSVRVGYLRVEVENPLPLDTCNQDPVLSSMQVFMNPQGTNFPLDPDQWNRIIDLLVRN